MPPSESLAQPSVSGPVIRNFLNCPMQRWAEIAGWRAADHVSTVGAKVNPARVVDQSTSRALSIPTCKLSYRGADTCVILPNVVSYPDIAEIAAILAPSSAINPALPMGRVSIVLQRSLRRLHLHPCIRGQMLKQRKQSLAWTGTK